MQGKTDPRSVAALVVLGDEAGILGPGSRRGWKILVNTAATALLLLLRS